MTLISAPRQQQKHGNLSATPKSSLKTDRKLEQLVHFMQGDEPTVSSNSAQVREKQWHFFFTFSNTDQKLLIAWLFPLPFPVMSADERN